jgi:predicted MPP superfamily phosphohydrolase
MESSEMALQILGWQFINVNRGFGFLGYPGRFGIWPEITVITLKKKGLT